jgi:hypothetical protein
MLRKIAPEYSEDSRGAFGLNEYSIFEPGFYSKTQTRNQVE